MGTGPSPQGAHPLRWAAAVVMMVAALMDMIDVTIVNVALPSIGRDLHAAEASLQWLMSAYMLGFAATLIVAGHLGDRFGRRPLFLSGTAGFGLASLACGLAQTPGQLVAARAVQGVAAALVLPQVLGSFRTLFQGRERGTAFGMYGAVSGFASAIGLLLGGLLTDADLFGWGWRSIFLVNAPVALATLVAGALLVPATRERSARRPDITGSMLLAAGLTAVVLPLVQGDSWGWPAWGWACMAAGVLALVAVPAVESRRGGIRAPLLPARAFRNPAFSLGAVVQLLFALGLQGFFLIFALWLQAGQGYSASQAGVVTIAFSVGSFLTAPVAAGLAVRFGRLVLSTGGVLMAAGFGWTWSAVDGASATHTGAWPLTPGLLLAGAGLGFLIVPLANVVLSAIPADIAGGASGIFTTAQQFGGAVGVAAIGTAFFRHTDGGLGDAFVHAAPWAVGAALCCALLCLWLPRTAVAEEDAL